MSKKFKDYLKVLAWGVFVAVCLTALTGYTRDEVKYVTVTYTVTKSDTLQTIAERFIVKNTGTVRQIDEFREGIRELNFDVIGNDEVKPGQILKIGWWEKK
ncbi:nucleoid-associated protein YgaU [Sporomusaceae bacterium BoRhaA]|uniref:LysM peptidoglycan-binding domain-containing protein n=1 Tax=Pelorhabdus rhamnosifermentans TaxID=2772457 RepID=UPI001C05EDBF|nr:LysM domain-containing protein [Pelorhabdus rhamnosifermentans]MBU2701111.1 nucleoid-associated protein YgaU [Pelorhabdus rhamnosifermentans]